MRYLHSGFLPRKTMDKNYLKAGVNSGCPLSIWMGYFMLYDGGLCVNRTPEEHAESNRMYYAHKGELIL